MRVPRVILRTFLELHACMHACLNAKADIATRLCICLPSDSSGPQRSAKGTHPRTFARDFARVRATSVPKTGRSVGYVVFNGFDGFNGINGRAVEHAVGERVGEGGASIGLAAGAGCSKHIGLMYMMLCVLSDGPLSQRHAFTHASSQDVKNTLLTRCKHVTVDGRRRNTL